MQKASLNHTYRVIWSDARNMWIAVAETAKAHGKGGQVKIIAAAIAAALSGLSSGSAFALCNGGSAVTSSLTVSDAQTGPCQVGNGGSVAVSSGGTITAGPGSNAVSGTGISTSGGVVNSGVMSGDSGILFKSSVLGGNITNGGTITGTAGNGIWLNSSTLAGSITNNAGGTITSSNHGVILHHSMIDGVISNAGTIRAAGRAIQLNASTPLGLSPGSTIGGIRNTGTVIGGSSAINIATHSTVNGGITNSGTIRGDTGHGIYLNASTVNGGINNSGTISGGSDGIVVFNHSTVNGGITNSGTISGGFQGIRIRVGSAVNNGINNSGMLTGSSTGIFARNTSTISGGITNSGTISGSKEGMLLGINSTISGGINNSGTISGGIDGIRVYSGSTVSGGINNSGTISGGTYAIHVDATSAVDRISIFGKDTAKFVGEVYAPNTPVTVASGASYTMQGGEVFTLNGTSSGFTVAGTGTLSVAAGGVGTITGNYVQEAGATFRTYVNNNTTYGQLSIGGAGAASLASGAKIDVHLSTPTSLAAGDTLQNIIHTSAAGKLTQTAFSVTDNSLGLNFTAINDGAGNIDVAASSSGMTTIAAAVAGSSAASGVAGALDTILTSGSADPSMQTLLTAITSSSNPAQVTSIVNQTLPLLTGGNQAATLAVIADVNRVVQARIESNRGLSSGDDFYGDNRFWMKPFGSWADQQDRKGVSGYSARTGGLAFGADGTISDATRVGASFAYAKASVTGNSTIAPNNADVNVYQLVGYGSHVLDQDTELSFQAGVGTNRNRGNRDITAVGMTAHSSYDSLTATLGAGVGRTYKLDALNAFTPSIRADYGWIKDKGYTESGAAGLNLHVNGRTTDELIIAADGKFVHEYKPETMVTANLGVGYDVLSKQASMTAAFAGTPATAFVTKGMDLSPWLIRGGLAIVGKMQNGMEISARYDAEYRQDFLNQTLSAKVRWLF